jgi:hypothetical protein
VTLWWWRSRNARCFRVTVEQIDAADLHKGFGRDWSSAARRQEVLIQINASSGLSL